MRRIIMANPQLDPTYKTWLSADYSSGTALTVLSNSTFSANDFLVVGEPGEEQTELRQIASLSGNTTININSAFRFTHTKDTPIYRSHWDFISLERRTSSSGTFSELTSLGIQWDKIDTIYYDSPATSAYEYRYRYNNSSLATYSEYSPTVSGAIPTRVVVQAMLDRIRKIANDPDRRVVSDEEIMNFLNTAQDIIEAVKKNWWFLRFEDSNITTTASTFKYNLDSLSSITLGNIETVRYRYDDGSTDENYPLEYVTPLEFYEMTQDVDRTNDDWVTNYTIDHPDGSSTDGYLLVYPTPATTGRGTFYVVGYESMNDLDTVEDSTQVPLPVILEQYAIAQIERIRGNETKADYYEALFYGPSEKEKENTRLSGIALLAKLDEYRKKPTVQLRQFKRYLGRRPRARFFARHSQDRDFLHENFWT